MFLIAYLHNVIITVTLVSIYFQCLLKTAKYYWHIFISGVTNVHFGSLAAINTHEVIMT